MKIELVGLDCNIESLTTTLVVFIIGLIMSRELGYSGRQCPRQLGPIVTMTVA